ncbi:Alpha-L-arabinofuranosidase II precursor [Citrobacter freundii]|uniref:Alpha-L-arabinofuranosidase II n=1 Tax=Citrobacter freundii TaxID=546 RepID=A0A7G2IJT6_CITFR|nr:Alpha-L-arabinofuranosidase II precursor [Citrobacter freundii]
MNQWPNPFIEQRADPFILRDGSHYYFIASVPEYDRLEIRRADSLEGLRTADPVIIWRKPESGPMSQLIWRPKSIIWQASGTSILPPPTHSRSTSWGCSSIACLRSNVPTPIR